MAKKDRIKTGLEYLLQMKEYLGDNKVEEFINDFLPHRTEETRRGIINRVNSIHTAKYSKKIPMPHV